MRIPFKIYTLDDTFGLSLNDIVRDYLSCPICLKHTVDLKEKETLLSVFWLGYSKSVYVCECCKKIVNPLTTKEVRDKKIDQLFK